MGLKVIDVEADAEAVEYCAAVNERGALHEKIRPDCSLRLPVSDGQTICIARPPLARGTAPWSCGVICCPRIVEDTE